MTKLLFVLLLSLALNPIYAQYTDTISDQLTQELKQIYSKGYINGFSVAIVNEDGSIYEKGFGFADIKENKPYTAHTIQNIASISKTFIGIALLKAQEMGKLDLDDPINNYLSFQVINPYFPNENITIRQLATHTSTISDPSRYDKNGYVLKESNHPEAKAKSNFRPPDEMISLEVFLESVLSQNGKWYKKSNFLKKKPGEDYTYSNIGAGLAAYILELATETTFPEFTKKFIFDPLKMSATGWNFESIDFSKHSKLYADVDTELAFYRLVTYPDGGLITSASDLSKYLSELIKGYNGFGEILQKESFDELFNPQLTESNFKERTKDEYDKGVFMEFSSKGHIGHSGSDPGVATFMFFNPKTSTGKILFVNTELKEEGINEFMAIWNKLGEYEYQLGQR